MTDLQKFEKAVTDLRAIYGLLQLAAMGLETDGEAGDALALTWLSHRLSETEKSLHAIYAEMFAERRAAKEPGPRMVPRGDGGSDG